VSALAPPAGSVKAHCLAPRATFSTTSLAEPLLATPYPPATSRHVVTRDI
jgi:hypothetical protein